jgi:hypothetical protein
MYFKWTLCYFFINGLGVTTGVLGVGLSPVKRLAYVTSIGHKPLCPIDTFDDMSRVKVRAKGKTPHEHLDRGMQSIVRQSRYQTVLVTLNVIHDVCYAFDDASLQSARAIRVISCLILFPAFAKFREVNHAVTIQVHEFQQLIRHAFLDVVGLCPGRQAHHHVRHSVSAWMKNLLLCENRLPSLRAPQHLPAQRIVPLNPRCHYHLHPWRKTRTTVLGAKLQ